MTTNDSPVCPRCGAPLPSDAPEGLCPRCLAAINFETGSLLTGTGASLPPPPIEEIAPHFPQLEILSCLGRGGMGVVYKARQISLDRLVALKLLAPEREKDPEFSDRFAREAQALARMSHPHIVTVHDFGQAGGFFYLLMEYVDGANLRQLLQSHKFTPEQALAVVPPLCDALQYAHDRGIVHRDIKPENLLMDRDGKLKVADFGLAKMLGTSASGDERPVGTPSYMAPEQSGDPMNVDNRADIYSLGVVIYEMLTGELPGHSFQPPSGKAAIDSRLDDVVQRAMETDPDKRYQQASILKTEVERISQVPPPPVAAPSAPFSEAAPASKAREDVRLSAIAMMIASGVSVVGQIFGVLMILAVVLVPFHALRHFQMPFGMPFGEPHENLVLFAMGGWALISVGLNIAALIGANRMRKFESYPWAIASAVILIACGVLSLPVLSLSLGGLLVLGQLAAGIWGLVVLLRPEVKAEFANSPPLEKSIPTDAPVTNDSMKRKLAIPAIGLMATAALNLLLIGLVLLVFLLRSFGRGPELVAVWVPLLGILFVVLPSLVTFIGAWRMRGMKNHVLSVVAAVLAILTPPGLLIGVIFGIWALVVLLDKDVKAGFQQNDAGSSGKGPLIAAAVAAALLVFLVVAVPVMVVAFSFRGSHRIVPQAPPVIMPSIPVPAQPLPPLAPLPPVYQPEPPRVAVPQVLAPANREAADLAARYSASQAISDFTVRDSALAGIARDAAASGNADIAKQALRGISAFTLRDSARKAAALLLCDRGMRADAVETARQITDFAMRDEVLTELSTRKPAALPAEAGE